MTTIRLTQSPGAVPNPELKARAHAQQMVDQLGVVFANCRFTLTGIANVSQNGQYDLDLVARRIDITRIERLNDVPSRIGSGLDAFTDVVEERMSTAGCARGQSYSEDTVLTARAKQHLTEVFQVLNTKLANCSFSLNAVFDASPNGEYGFSFTARRLDTGKTFTFELEADFNVDAFTDAESYRPLLKDELRASGCVWKGGARVPTSTTSISLKKAASDHVRSAFIALNQRMTNCKVTLIAVTDAFANGEYKYGFSLMQGVGQQQHLDDWTSSTTASIEEEIASYREEFASLKTGCLFK